MKARRGGFAIGLVVGVLIGLALALGVALYITRAPNPFINKVPGRTAEQDKAEAERNRNWDPNAALAGKRPSASEAAAGLPMPASGAASSAPAAGIAVVPGPGRPRDPAAILSGGAPGGSGAPAMGSAAGARSPAAAPGGPDPFVYFVQAGAFTRNDDAEQQRARLAMLGYSARITERDQAGRTVYRVRMGPYTTRDEADALQLKLQGSSIESQLVRVEKP